MKLLQSISEICIILFILLFITSLSYSFWKNTHQTPVVTNMSITESFKYYNGTWSTKISGSKDRNCVYIPSENKGLALINDKWIEVYFFYTNDVTPGNNRPLGYQDFDSWNWISSENTKALKLLVKHLCENDQIVTTVIGPFKTK